MYCPFCRNPDSRVVDSRIADDGSAIRRRRQCPECGRRFTTVETTSLTVIKRSGVGEPFSRSKVINYTRSALEQVSGHIVSLSGAEDLPAHGEAVTVRFAAR